jgi:enterochelin esterase-like enzyme
VKTRIGRCRRFEGGGCSSNCARNGAAGQHLPADELIAKQIKLLWISCGDQDNLINISQRTHSYLKEQNIPHIYHVNPGGKHDFAVWKNDLYLFSQKIFR